MFVPEIFVYVPENFQCSRWKFSLFPKKFSLKILMKNEMMDIHILDGW